MNTDHDPAVLARAALAARARAYAPYSRYAVGAALLDASGRIHAGCNVENASYGLTVCAERVAVFRAVADGHRTFTALAVATEGGASPCGACRQVLREFSPALPIILVAADGSLRTTRLDVLLPDSFGPEALPTGPAR